MRQFTKDRAEAACVGNAHIQKDGQNARSVAAVHEVHVEDFALRNVHGLVHHARAEGLVCTFLVA
ncbi:hypothetical protein AAY81_03810 [Denitrobacterium detoxificans]|nr:hypothetical protein AAY81_03810 [Denitrobacterium detoxificans]